MIMEPSREYAREYFHAAEQALQEAAVLFDKLLLNGAVSRAYYAMFYAASAALLAQGVKLPKKHKTVATLFYHHLVETGSIPRASHQSFIQAFKMRQQTDYEVRSHLDAGEVRHLLENAEAFVDGVKKVVYAR